MVKMKFDKNIHFDNVSVCTPNYLHDAHIRFSFRRESDTICEEPLVLKPRNIDALTKWKMKPVVEFGIYYNLGFPQVSFI